MADFITVAPGFAVAGQLTAEDFARAAAAGFRLVLNNRPDGEAPGQLPSAEAQRAARAAGLAYQAVPVTGATLQQSVAAEQAALKGADGPVLAYCRTGSRSLALWALAETRGGARSAEQVLQLAQGAGYDLSRLRPALEAAQG